MRFVRQCCLIGNISFNHHPVFLLSKTFIMGNLKSIFRLRLDLDLKRFILCETHSHLSECWRDSRPSKEHCKNYTTINTVKMKACPWSNLLLNLILVDVLIYGSVGSLTIWLAYKFHLVRDSNLYVRILVGGYRPCLFMVKTIVFGLCNT